MSRAEKGFLAAMLLVAGLIVASLPLLDCICVRSFWEPGPSFVDCSVCRNTREISPLKRLTVHRPDRQDEALLRGSPTSR